ncbi:urokinase plasminogen activator surface receptor-like [Lissotriton helveticus]
MQAVLRCLLFSAVLVQVSALECYVCSSRGNCTEATETCEQNQTSCSAAVTQAISGDDNTPYISKGCSQLNDGNVTKSSVYGRRRTVQSVYYCTTDLCNKEVPVIGPEWNETNGFQCYNYGCSSSGDYCNKTNIHIQNCTGLENQCMSSYFHSSNGRGSEISKGCMHDPGATGPVGWKTHSTFILIHYCNSSLCNNHTTDFQNQNQTFNGLKCFSCDGRGTDCSSQNQTIVECFEPLSHCMDYVSYAGGQRTTDAFKGCATPASCQEQAKISALHGVQHQLHCCQESLCNGQVGNSTTMEEASTMSTTRASSKSTARSKTSRNGGTLVLFPAALLMISASWSLMMNPSF